MLREAIHRFHGAAGVEVAARLVEGVQQLGPVVKSIERQTVNELELESMIRAASGQLALHAGLEFTLEHFRQIGTERIKGRPQKAGPGTVADQGPTLHEIDKRWGVVFRRGLQLGDDGAEGRPATERLQILGWKA